MAKDEYGGTVVLKEFLISGRILDRKITRPALHAAKPLPAKKRRLEKLDARQHKRDRYYENVVERKGRGPANLYMTSSLRDQGGENTPAPSGNWAA